MYPYQLKIKIKSLVAETAIIRHLERKHEQASIICERRRLETEDDEQRKLWAKRTWPHLSIIGDLTSHRTGIIRDVMRSTLLAYGYLRGRTYAQIEGTSKTSPDWAAVDRMVLKYGTKDQWRALPDWLPERDNIRIQMMEKDRVKAA